MTVSEVSRDEAVRRSAPNPTSVLIVDDNPDMRSFVRIVLEGAGFEVQVAADGGRALELQRARPVDVLVTDIFMPECDGIELIDQFKSAYPHVKVIAVSGGGKRTFTVDYLPVAAEIGADRVLRKPFGADTLLGTLREVVS